MIPARMFTLPRLLSLLGVALAVSAQAAITISGVVDKTKYDNTATFTVTAARRRRRPRPRSMAWR